MILIEIFIIKMKLIHTNKKLMILFLISMSLRLFKSDENRNLSQKNSFVINNNYKNDINECKEYVSSSKKLQR